jgi:hypothetical protein
VLTEDPSLQYPPILVWSTSDSTLFVAQRD